MATNTPSSMYKSLHEYRIIRVSNSPHLCELCTTLSVVTQYLSLCTVSYFTKRPALHGAPSSLVANLLRGHRKTLLDTTLPYWDPRARYVIDGYRNLPSPFKNLRTGREGKPLILDMVVQDVTLDRFSGLMRSWSAVAIAREQGVELLSDDEVKKLEPDPSN
ncbi:hypothetical protein B296_00013117 [Ensete ventricosum]|uniref:Uncharacterized protein n=1 Tax=Ensete ventricosum TaxID=4639 RepID=A0A427AX28_ENSVE|nr:hypothetical protein B296_00013117 [Ensete ventricosum]